MKQGRAYAMVVVVAVTSSGGASAESDARKPETKQKVGSVLDELEKKLRKPMRTDASEPTDNDAAAKNYP